MFIFINNISTTIHTVINMNNQCYKNYFYPSAFLASSLYNVCSSVANLDEIKVEQDYSLATHGWIVHNYPFPVRKRFPW